MPYILYNCSTRILWRILPLFLLSYQSCSKTDSVRSKWSTLNCSYTPITESHIWHCSPYFTEYYIHIYLTNFTSVVHFDKFATCTSNLNVSELLKRSNLMYKCSLWKEKLFFHIMIYKKIFCTLFCHHLHGPHYANCKKVYRGQSP